MVLDTIQYCKCDGKKTIPALHTMQEILKQRGWEGDYPLFTTVNRIVSGYFPPTDIVNFKEVRAVPAVKLQG
jgi:hypothetical protein